MGRINVLDTNTANLIAAGEVIENPAAVVKELVENSLDAGARHVDVEITAGGRELILVEDDGAGIDPDDLPLALLRHATSKIRGAEDLFRIKTMGFRGEALPSIAAVSRLTITTRTPGRVSALRLVSAGGSTGKVEECAAPPGTKVEVEDLFYNTPARLKFLSSPPAEAARISRLLTALSLANPETAVTLRSEGRLALSTAGVGRLDQSLLDLFGKEAPGQLVSVIGETGGISVSGQICKPEFARRSRGRQFLFVNRRPVQSPSLRYSLESAYEGLIPRGRFPWGCLMIAIDPELVDVNVHPAKREVKFKDAETVTQAVRKAVKAALGRGERVPGIPGDRQDPVISLPFTFSPQNLPPLNIRETGEAAPLASKPFSNTAEPAGPVPFRQEATAETQGLKVLGQVFTGYIAAVSGDQLLLVDQHAAHERVLYQEYRRQGPGMATQQVIPYPIELPAAEAQSLREKLVELAEAGLMVDEFGNNTFIIRAVPVFIKDIYNRHLVEDLIQLAAAGGRGEELINEIITTMACKAAVKITQPLPLPQQEGLLARLFQTEDPAHCPHGRPVMLRITKAFLEKELGRKGG